MAKRLIITEEDYDIFKYLRQCKFLTVTQLADLLGITRDVMRKKIVKFTTYKILTVTYISARTIRRVKGLTFTPEGIQWVYGDKDWISPPLIMQWRLALVNDVFVRLRPNERVTWRVYIPRKDNGPDASYRDSSGRLVYVSVEPDTKEEKKMLEKHWKSQAETIKWV